LVFWFFWFFRFSRRIYYVQLEIGRLVREGELVNVALVVRVVVQLEVSDLVRDGLAGCGGRLGRGHRRDRRRGGSAIRVLGLQLRRVLLRGDRVKDALRRRLALGLGCLLGELGGLRLLLLGELGCLGGLLLGQLGGFALGLLGLLQLRLLGVLDRLGLRLRLELGSLGSLLLGVLGGLQLRLLGVLGSLGRRLLGELGGLGLLLRLELGSLGGLLLGELGSLGGLLRGVLGSLGLRLLGELGSLGGLLLLVRDLRLLGLLEGDLPRERLGLSGVDEAEGIRDVKVVLGSESLHDLGKLVLHLRLELLGDGRHSSLEVELSEFV